MTICDPIELLFGGMEKLGPGDKAYTLRILHSLPKQRFRVVVDAGCGTGYQTLALAKVLRGPIQAVDSYQPFLNELRRRAREENIAQHVQVHCLDMQDIPRVFQDIDLLWSEGAAYNIGFENALTSWATALTSHGLAVISELSWLKKPAPDAVTAFFRIAYPDMRSVSHNIAIAERAGYHVLATVVLPRQAWVDGYYDILEPRAKALLDHAAPSVRDFAAETIKEIEVFRRSEGSYGYVFYLLERRD